MISRYALYDTAEISKRFSVDGGLPKGIKPSYNISPTIAAPIIVSREGINHAVVMKWGLLPKGAKDGNSAFRYKTYNLASENIFSRHSWEQAVRERRCLVPANGFYLLNGSGKKLAYYAQPSDEKLIALAGVYNSWVTPDGFEEGTYSVITIDASSDMPVINNRMPVIIKSEDEARWLSQDITDTSSVYDMLREHPVGSLSVREVSAAVHSPKPNQPSLIEPLA